MSDETTATVERPEGQAGETNPIGRPVKIGVGDRVEATRHNDTNDFGVIVSATDHGAFVRAEDDGEILGTPWCQVRGVPDTPEIVAEDAQPVQEPDNGKHEAEPTVEAPESTAGFKDRFGDMLAAIETAKDVPPGETNADVKDIKEECWQLLFDAVHRDAQELELDKLAALAKHVHGLVDGKATSDPSTPVEAKRADAGDEPKPPVKPEPSELALKELDIVRTCVAVADAICDDYRNAGTTRVTNPWCTGCILGSSSTAFEKPSRGWTCLVCGLPRKVGVPPIPSLRQPRRWSHDPRRRSRRSDRGTEAAPDRVRRGAHPRAGAIRGYRHCSQPSRGRPGACGVDTRMTAG